jgi:hypothetical protein
VQSQHWIDSVHRELRRRHLPPAYIARLLGELRDHAEDLELHAADIAAPAVPIQQSLGLPHDVAQAALLEFRQTRFAGRHPILVFVLLPLPLAALTFFALALAAALFAACGPVPIDTSTLEMQVFRFTLVLSPLLLPAALLCRIARRAAIGLLWRTIACALLSAIAAFIYSQVDSPSLTGHGRMFIAFQAPHSQIGRAHV